MKVDLMMQARPLSDLAGFARGIRGFDGVVVTETARTATLTCAVLALETDMDVMTGVTVAFGRSPMVTAQMAWELAEACAGRFRLGLGAQVRAHIERRFSAEYSPPGPRLRDYVLALRAIFAAFRGETELNYVGSYYRHTLLPKEWSPGPIRVGNPPLDIAAVSPWMLSMAGEVADGVHLHPLSTQSYLRGIAIPAVRAGMEKAGRTNGEFSVIVPMYAAPGDTPEERREGQEAVRRRVAFYASTPNYSLIFERLGRGDVTPRLSALYRKRDVAGMLGVIDDELLEEFCISGPWDELADAIIAKYDGFATRVVAYPPTSDWFDDHTRLSKWAEVARDIRHKTQQG